jgi:hypothetical protein
MLNREMTANEELFLEMLELADDDMEGVSGGSIIIGNGNIGDGNFFGGGFPGIPVPGVPVPGVPVPGGGAVNIGRNGIVGNNNNGNVQVSFF